MAKTIVVPDDAEVQGMTPEQFDSLNTRLTSMPRHDLDAMAHENGIDYDASAGRDVIAGALITHALNGNELKWDRPDNWNRRSEGEDGVSPPDDEEPLPFESQADYQARRRAVEQDAARKERDDKRDARKSETGADRPADTMPGDPERLPGESDEDYDDRVREHRENDGSPAPIDEPEAGAGAPPTGATSATAASPRPASRSVPRQPGL